MELEAYFWQQRKKTVRCCRSRSLSLSLCVRVSREMDKDGEMFFFWRRYLSVLSPHV